MNNENKNYKLIESEFIEEIQSTANHLIHIITGAKLLYIENKSEIKTFGIGFATPPSDSKGIPHIVEHSVLSGSRKYKTKEPFMDLVNGSTQLFLNAMTYKDKTLYPLSTRNEKDFYNLMDVYLDAVFYPVMYEREEIFKQEGWHYELEDMESDISYNGIVYNEMKGVYSDPEEQINELIGEAIYPNSTYAHDSGGNPYDITNLSYEEFLDFHRKYYHPSNSFIYLHGDLNIDQVLDYLDREYLSDFQATDVDGSVILSEATSTEEVIMEYSIAADEDPKSKDYFSYSVVLGESTDNEAVFMRLLLSELLLDADSAPLKLALLDSKMGDDYYTGISSNLPLDLSFILKNGNGEDFHNFIDLIDRELNRLVSEGISRELVDATINKFEFSLREPSGIHEGLSLYIRALSGWRYGGNPLDSLKFVDIIEKIKNGIDDRYIENYISEHILSNPYKKHIHMVAKPGMYELLDISREEQLVALKEKMSPSELEELIASTADLVEYQMSEDSEEAKATIPSLELEDIKSDAKDLDTRIENWDTNTILKTVTPSNGIVYMNMSFDTSHISEEELPTLGVLLSLLGNMDTENYSHKELDSKIYIETGGVSFSSKTYTDFKDGEVYYPKLNVHAKALHSNTDSMIDVIQEIVTKSIFQDKNRILDLIKMEKSEMDMRMESSGHSLIVSTLSALFRKSVKYLSLTDDLDFYLHLDYLLEVYDEEFEKLIDDLQTVYRKVFNGKNITFSIATEERYTDSLDEKLNALIASLPSEEYSAKDISLETDIKSIAILSQSNVHYVGSGFDYNSLGYEYDGSFAVMSSILSGTYLHNNVRAKGGAYGVGVRIGTGGMINFYSYRDPNIQETLNVYSNTDEFLSSVNFDDGEMTKFIIGILNAFDPPISPKGYAATALSRHLTGFGVNELEFYKKQALETNSKTLQSYAKMFTDGLAGEYLIVYGNKDNILNSGIEFDKYIDLSR